MGSNRKLIKMKFKSIRIAVLGDRETVDTERYFITMTTFISSIFLALLSIFHLVENLKLAPFILAGSSSLLLIGMYFLLRFGRFLFYPKLVITLLGLLSLDITWYSKFLSSGPLLLFILVFAALVIWVWEGKALLIMLCVYFINIAVLFVIEQNTPAYLLQYPDKELRSIDIYISFLFYSILMISLLYTAKKQFQRQKDKAVESDILKSAFLANMSHELRTPMNHIIGFSALLENEEDSEKRLEFLKIIQNSGAGLLKLITDLIDLSKIEAGDILVSMSNFSINEMFIELKQIYTYELQKREKSNVQLNYHLPGTDFIIYTDPIRLKQILSNLLNNAIKFTVSGTIEYSCYQEGKELIFSLSDTGVGIPETDRKHIFERFKKYNYQGMNNEGTGIGLSIAEKIVMMLNGRIWLESAVGEGTTFLFSIPYTGNTVAITPNQKNMEHTKAVKTNVFRKTILVVDDDKVSYLLIKELLRPLNYNIEFVTNGKDAVDFIKLRPETVLILMDIQLPYMDGYEATSEIRKFNNEIPIIAQTAYAMTGDREKAIDAGCNDYLAKPLDLNKLNEVVKSYISN